MAGAERRGLVDEGCALWERGTRVDWSDVIICVANEAEDGAVGGREGRGRGAWVQPATANERQAVQPSGLCHG